MECKKREGQTHDGKKSGWVGREAWLRLEPSGGEGGKRRRPEKGGGGECPAEEENRTKLVFMAELM